MTSEPDNKSSRRPPTIELKATEVDQPNAAAPAGGGGSTEAPPKESSTPRPRQSATSTSRLKSQAAGAILGAVAVVVIVAVLWFARFAPPREAAAPSPPAPETSAAVQSAPNSEAAISARLDKLERAMEAQQAGASQNKQIPAAEAQTKALSDSMAALSRRVDNIAAASQSAAKTADAAQAAAEAAKATSEKASQAASDAASKAASEAASQAATQVASQTGVQKNDLDALTNRIAALENAVKALSENAAHPAEGADDQAARLTIAAEALRATVERGAPYQAELAAVQALGVSQDAVAPLQPFAATGVPTTAALAHELETLAASLRRAAETPSGGSTFLERLEAHARNLVQITPVDAPPGDEPAAVMARIEIDAAHADIAAAQSDIAALPQAAKPLAADWFDEAKAREAAIAASRKIAAAALANLSKPASQ
jgi:hypothetical protein